MPDSNQHSTPQDALEWLRQIAEPDRDPNSWSEGEYPLVIQAMMQRARDAEPILRGLLEQYQDALDALDKGRRFERFYQESLGATPTATQYEILDNLQSAFIDAYVPLVSNPASEPKP